MKNKYVKILDLSFIAEDKKTILDLINKRVDNNEKTFVITANAEIAMYARENKDYLELAKTAHYIVADGIGVVKGAKILDEYIPERVPGIELMTDMLEYANNNDKKVYFYGAKPEVIDKMVEVLKVKYSNLNIVGYHHGYHDDSDNSIMNYILNLEPDYVFVAKGCPLQDKWIQKVMKKANKGVFMGVGGSFDVISGHVKRAPEFWRKLNLEWLYRVLSNPQRVGRYIALPKFVLEVMKDRRKS
ncbi:WecB/TagA/CpsF family glycosyltransferase [Romboutsia lituseburensis]|uniref:WecB/TagA/CpsF family glycosyltransferase n=1 Tax=Romboutsia lituseburensis TaxID=1537 RepID=UPI00215B5DF1|nr:WecB/TagA/CpsF family glycosyltransferase [Romboutsia lituseburensis]MCR8745432.1 WecB/TagA/CpsF family glycosyltransferase [Romboutsia lituseburensis]